MSALGKYVQGELVRENASCVAPGDLIYIKSNSDDAATQQRAEAAEYG